MMQTLTLTRRLAILGAAASLGGCSALASLNEAATPLDTYDLVPVPGSTAGHRSGQTLLVARPDTPASIATDRIMIKPNNASITYLPNARWTDNLPEVMQSLLIRSTAGTGRMGFVGPGEGGPVPDLALLTRIDRFQIEVTGGLLLAKVDISLTLMRDRDQRVLKTRLFSSHATAASDEPIAVVAAFQAILDSLLPKMANWIAAT